MNTLRNRDIYASRMNGKTFREIAQGHDISTERARHICVIYALRKKDHAPLIRTHALLRG